MGLFFSAMVCDEGTWGQVYARRNDTCVPTPKAKANKVGTTYNTLAECEAQESPVEPEEREAEQPESRIATTHQHELGTEMDEPEIGHTLLSWRDCGSDSKWVNFTSLTPTTMKIGGKVPISGVGDLLQDIEEADFSIKMTSGALGITLMDFKGDACKDHIAPYTLFDQIRLGWNPLTCPVRAGTGAFVSHLDLWVDTLVPATIAHTTTTVMAHSKAGEEIFCMEVVTKCRPMVDDAPNDITV